MSQSHSGIEIPESLKACIAEIASVCEKHGIGYIVGTIKPSFKDPWRDIFEFEWEEPGHGGRNGVRIKTTVRDIIDVPKAELEQPGKEKE